MNNPPPLSAESVRKGITQARARWIDAQMREHLPKRIYDQVHSGDGEAQAIGINWVKEQGYAIEDEREMVILKKGDKILAQVKMMLEVDDKGLRDLAKSATKIRQVGV